MNALKEAGKRIGFSKYIMFHPFKGFWDLKHDKIGTIGVSAFFVLILSILGVMNVQLTGFIVNGSDKLSTNVFFVLIRYIAIFLVWVIANWSITTLLDGEGTVKDIFIATAYALVPYILSNAVMIVMSNFIIAEEATFYYLIQIIGLIWSGMLLIFGLMTIHQFSFGKTVLTVIIAIVAMIIILFLLLMFLTLLQQMINFVSLILQEVIA